MIAHHEILLIANAGVIAVVAASARSIWRGVCRLRGHVRRVVAVRRRE